ncbi:MAG: FAD-binding oxidoreductase [Deltaproteobacteria bacterium]|nr:MAG: FAD-binding oxidoreductase [Deltaproteobacteria bacterium]
MIHSVDPAVLEALEGVVGPEGLSVDPADLDFYGRDRAVGPWPVRAGAVVRPATVEAVSEVVRVCEARGVGIVPSGGRTGLAGAAVAPAGEVVLSVERMRGVLAVDPVARTVRCRAGTTVAEVDAAAREHGLFYPVDFAAKGTAQVGGTIATNAGGVRVVRYGPTRAWVRGIVAVTGGGEVLELGRGLVKDNTGYALEQLFVGAEGTLGIVVEATLGLAVPPASTCVAVVGARDVPALLTLYRRLGTVGLRISAFECFDAGCLGAVLEARGQGTPPLATEAPIYGLVEVEADAVAEATAVQDALVEALCDAQEDGVVVDATVAQTAAQARALWSLRESVSEALHPRRPHKSDVTIPQSNMPRFLDELGDVVARHVPEGELRIFGHLGDGNLHVNLLPPKGGVLLEESIEAFDAELYRLVGELGGSLSAEHGIGLLKRAYLPLRRSPVEIDLMRRIKQVFDPKGVFNPGKVFPPTDRDG